jgi:8-oxo-dGTP diphosphatase
MGARADGWWHDPAGAALRICREVIALAGRGDETAGAWVLVLEGRARAAVARLESETTLVEDTAPPDEWVPPVDESPAPDQTAPVRLVSAPGSGDDAIVGVVAEAAGEDESCLVVTADRELRRRCEELNASVVGPGWLLRLLLPGNIEVNRPSASSPLHRTMWVRHRLLYRPEPDAYVRDPGARGTADPWPVRADRLPHVG